MKKTISLLILLIINLNTPVWSKSPTTNNTKLTLLPEELVNIKVYKTCNKAVVNISTIATAEDLFFNVSPKEGMGSGTIISNDGYILTNNHVIERAQNISVTLFDGLSLRATIVGCDPSNDIAILKIDPPKNIKLTIIPFGDSNQLEVGRKVLAIGNPFGLTRTLTVGIVSSLGRTLKTETGRMIKGVIQTDAAINPGNSGGPLLDSQGKMVGITTAILSRSGQSSGIGFAIPINIAKGIIPELIANHGIIRPDLGILAFQPTELGLKIVKLDPNGPAAQAGLSGPKLVVYQQGPFTIQSVDSTQADIIVGIDNQKIQSVDDLLSYLEKKKPGQNVTINVLRNGKLKQVTVKLGVSST